LTIEFLFSDETLECLVGPIDKFPYKTVQRDSIHQVISCRGWIISLWRLVVSAAEKLRFDENC